MMNNKFMFNGFLLLIPRMKHLNQLTFQLQVGMVLSLPVFLQIIEIPLVFVETGWGEGEKVRILTFTMRGIVGDAKTTPQGEATESQVSDKY